MKPVYHLLINIDQIKYLIPVILSRVLRVILLSRIFNNVWAHFWLLQLRVGVCYQHLVGGAQGCDYSMQGSHMQQRITRLTKNYWTQMSIVPELTKPGSPNYEGYKTNETHDFRP